MKNMANVCLHVGFSAKNAGFAPAGAENRVGEAIFGKKRKYLEEYGINTYNIMYLTRARAMRALCMRKFIR